MNEDPVVSVVIPTRNRRDKLLRCINSILASRSIPLEVIIVDDSSDYQVADDLKKYYRTVKVHRNNSRRLLSYSRNIGAKLSRGRFVLFIDDDNVIAVDAILNMVKSFESGKVAVCSPIIYQFDKPTKVWTSYILKGRFPGFYVLGGVEPMTSVDTFSFHDAFMVRRSVFEELGGFDDKTFPIHFSELDFAYRVHKSGRKALVNPAAKVWHDTGKVHMHVDSVRSFFTLRNRIILLRRYASRKEFLTYAVSILPLLTAYYLIHHMRYAPDHRFLASYNLLKGVISGLAFREALPPRFEHGSFIEKSLRKSEESDSEPLVSVIIPTKNSEATIGKCLESLRRQSYKNMEIIIVDNNSDDTTVAIANSFGNVRVLSCGPERSAQLNFGVRHANGRFVYRVDSDFVLENHVIQEAVRKCVNEGFKVVTVHNTSDPSISFWSRVRKLERDCYEDDVVHIAARFFDKEAFQSVGGFDEELIASEDYDLHNRLVNRGFRIGRIRAKELHLGEPKKLSEVVTKHIFYGKMIDVFIQRNPGMSLRQLSPVRTAYFRHWKYFLRDPRLTMGFLIYQYVRYLSAIIGYSSTKV